MLFRNWTDKSVKVIKLSQSEAKSRGSYHVGTEHLLLAMLHEDMGVSGEILGSFGISSQGVSDALHILEKAV